jgi:sugar transferase EpsL
MFPKGVPLAKRCLDLILTSLGLVLISPVLIILSLLVWIKIGRPILFSQIRPGYKGKLFKMFKYRTMTEDRDEQGNLLPDQLRLTGIGQFLRDFSLDELPQFFNVVRGEMSLVGPRPLLVQYLTRYSPEQARRHDVLPGVTGWAQINGRNALTWEDKFLLDTWYVDNWSFWLDIRILALTFWKTLKREGINQPGFVTTPEFMGNTEESSEGEK